MPRTTLTDLAVQRLKPTAAQTRYFDDSLPGFGILVGKRTKTFFILKGEDRKLVTLGRYPSLSLRDARSRARLKMVQSTVSGGIDAPGAILAYLGEVKGRIEKQTHDQYTYYLNFFGFKGPVEGISRAHIKRKLSELAGKPTAQNMAYATLRGFLNWCLRQEYIDRHPLLGMAPPNKLSSRKRVLSDEELKAIWKSTGTDGSPGWMKFSKIVRILMLTGQRRQEIGDLQPDHVTDFLSFPVTKNGHPHMIPITPAVREHLQVPWNFNDWNRCKELLDRRSGVTGWVIHDLRRTWATLAARLGVPVHVIEATLNHRTGAITPIGRIYNLYSYAPEIHRALLTVEQYTLKLVAAQGTNPELTRGLSPKENHREVSQQERTATETQSLDPTHHPRGEDGTLSEASPTVSEPGGVGRGRDRAMDGAEDR